MEGARWDRVNKVLFLYQYLLVWFVFINNCLVSLSLFLLCLTSSFQPNLLFTALSFVKRPFRVLNCSTCIIRMFKWDPFSFLQMSSFFMKYSASWQRDFLSRFEVINRDLFSDSTVAYFYYKLNGKQGAFFLSFEPSDPCFLCCIVGCWWITSKDALWHCSNCILWQQISSLKSDVDYYRHLFVGILWSTLIPSAHAVE